MTNNRRMKLSSVALLFALVWGLLPSFAVVQTMAAAGGPARRKVAVFLQGVCSQYPFNAAHKDLFADLKGQLKDPSLKLGYSDEDFLDFSYKGGSVNASSGKWQPDDYSETDPVGQAITLSWSRLHDMLLIPYRAKHPDTTFVLVGHSLGGVIAFQEVLDSIAKPGYESGFITSVITVDSPLAGVTDWNKRFGDVAPPCADGNEIGYIAQAPLNLNNRYNDSTFRKTAEDAVEIARGKGVTVRTVGNTRDCLWHPSNCTFLGLGFGDIDTQWINGAFDKEDKFTIPCQDNGDTNCTKYRVDKSAPGDKYCPGIDIFARICYRPFLTGSHPLFGKIRIANCKALGTISTLSGDCAAASHNGALDNPLYGADALLRIASHIGPQISVFPPGTVTPSPGTATTIVNTIKTPIVPTKPDIIFLADTTGSMGGAIANVRANAASVMSQVKASQPNAAFGAAEYEDFNCSASAFAYKLNQATTTDTNAVQGGIDSWQALRGEGCDDPEAQLNALYLLATSGGVGWRSGANRIVAWFGDVPGHDPSGGHSLTQVINALKTAGIRVIAVNVSNLDGCADASCNQATQITQATKGTLISASVGGSSVSSVLGRSNDPTGPQLAAGEDVAGAILAGLTTLPVTITPQLTGCGPGVTVTFDKPSATVISGESVTFTATISVATSLPAGTGVNCRIDYLLDGKIVDDAGVTTPVEIVVPTVYNLTVTAAGGNSASAAPIGPSYQGGTVAILAATPKTGQVFIGWKIDGAFAGWANPTALTMDKNHTAEALFGPLIAFSDVPTTEPGYPYVAELAARGIVKGYSAAGCAARGQTAPCLGPGDTVQRAQIAAMIVRTMGWDNENPGPAPFSDLGGLDPELQRAIGILAARGVAFGYVDGSFGPNDEVLYEQVALLIGRAMIQQGLWVLLDDDRAIYPNIAGDTEQQRKDRRTLVTYVKNAGAFSERPQDQPWGDRFDRAPRVWTVQVLWQALDSHFGR